MEQLINKDEYKKWYLRPVFFVSSLHQTLDFYVGKLGFEKAWHKGDGMGKVCQVNRGGAEIILCEDDARTDRSRAFLELTRKGVDQLLIEIDEHAISTQKLWWGLDVLQIKDPAGNELLVCLENLA